jgi:hypothetical protein
VSQYLGLDDEQITTIKSSLQEVIDIEQAFLYLSRFGLEYMHVEGPLYTALLQNLATMDPTTLLTCQELMHAKRQSRKPKSTNEVTDIRLKNREETLLLITKNCNWRQSIQGLLMREADWPLIRQANQLVYTYEQAQAFYILGYLGEPDICHETLEVALPVMAFLDWCCPAVPGIRNNFLDGQVYPQNVGEDFIQHSIRVPIAAAVPGVPQVGIIAQQGFVAAVPRVPAVYGPIPRYAAIHPVQGAANRTALATALRL